MTTTHVTPGYNSKAKSEAYRGEFIRSYYLKEFKFHIQQDTHFKDQYISN